MRKWAVLPIVVAVVGILMLELLYRIGIIAFGVGHLLARLWGLIPIGLGLYFLLGEKEKQRYKTGYVLILFGFIFLALNIAILFTEDQQFVFDFASLALLLFWPAVLIMLAVSVFFSWFATNEQAYGIRFGNRVIPEGLWDPEDTTLSAVLGKITLRIRPEEVVFRSVRLDAWTVLGAVVVEVPPGVAVVIEGKNFLGTVNFLGSSKTRVFGTEQNRYMPPGDDDPPYVLITSRTFLGKVEVRELTVGD